MNNLSFQEFVISPDEIIAILDLDSATESVYTRDFLRECERKKILISASKDLPRSIVITDRSVYLVGINSKTLLQRMTSEVFRKQFSVESTK